VQPGAGVGPRTIDGTRGEAESFGHFENRKSGEISQFHDLRGDVIDALEQVQHLIHRDQLLGGFRRLNLLIVEGMTLQIAPTPQR
jgi:hypothetical protein